MQCMWPGTTSLRSRKSMECSLFVPLHGSRGVCLPVDQNFHLLFYSQILTPSPYYSTEGIYYSQRFSYCRAGSEATNRAAMSLNEAFEISM